ncbi:Sas10/Utp3 family protein [Penicillium brasilianum]|uniref:Sas10/Utp3 family protein n=1 Tax=Penicillium brasilianum TaxID=104259 RepID=A0A1S9RFV0_PENBI|nr:Sas10/Utp3 family protein [Penicillium brasilianum]
MGKKRKAGGRPAHKEDAPLRSKFSVEERFEDSEDEFQANRDQILLEEAPEAKRRRRVAEDEEVLQPSDEEILGYESVDEDEDDLEDEEDYDEDDDMGLSKKARDAVSDEEEEGIAAWGSSRKDLYNADQIETEADALEEEQEAKRLQQKQLQAMNEADFGFDESEWVESGKTAEDDAEDNGVITEVLPQLEVTEDMDDDEKRKILSSRYPEFEPLAKEFASLQTVYKDLQKAASKATSTPREDSDEPQPAPVAVVKLRALSTYLGTISLYFMLLASSPEGSDTHVPLSPAELRQHPVMGSLVKFRKLWETVKDLEISEPVKVIEKPVKVVSSEPTKAEKQPKKTKEVKEVPQKKKLSRAERAAEIARAEAEARRAERLRQTEADLADLDDLVTAPTQKRKTKKSQKSKDDDESDFGDEGALTAREAEEKAKQKRSLRFYTSQIAQKANKRQSAGVNAGGDADIPYRERLKDRQARLNAEAEKRGRQRPDIGEELGGDSDDEDHRVRKELRSGGNQSGTDEDEYYDMVAARSKQRKDDKKARADAYAAAAREGGHVQIQEEIGADGKRAITYQIEKNKGLTPKRSKDARNPRVKKRKKYEEKKKKLGSIRQVYKGGEARGGYGGELTGIKKNLVKSVKF